MPKAKYDPRARELRRDTLISHLDLEGDLADVILRLQSVPLDHPDYLRYEIEDDYSAYSDYLHYNVIGHRLENDEEYAQRMEVLARQEALAKEQKKAQRVKDEEELERLARKLKKRVVDA